VLVVRRWPRFAAACAASGALTWWSYRHTGPWEWWLPVVLLLAVVIVVAWTPSKRETSPPEPQVVVHSDKRPVGVGV